MRALKALLSLLAFSSSTVLVNGLPTLGVKDGTTVDISLEPGEPSTSSLRGLSRSKSYFLNPFTLPVSCSNCLPPSKPSANMEILRQAPRCHHIYRPGAGLDLNAFTLQQPVNILSELPFNSKHGPLEYTSVVDASTVVLGGPPFQAQNHGLVHTLRRAILRHSWLPRVYWHSRPEDTCSYCQYPRQDPSCAPKFPSVTQKGTSLTASRSNSINWGVS